MVGILNVSQMSRNKWNKWTNYPRVKSVFQKGRNLQGAKCYLSQFHTITLTYMPQFKGKQHSESPNESALIQPCNKPQAENQETSVTDKMKISTDIILKTKK